MAGRCFFVSDLHMFARRSQTHRWEQPIRDAVLAAKTVVFGGDIFDFRWSTLESTDATIDASIRWLADTIAVNPRCRFHYVMGNHDFNERFANRLNEFARDCNNFDWHPYHLRLGNTLFLHGDVTDRRTTHQELIQARRKWLADESRHAFRHRLYDLAIGLRLHKLVSNVLHRESAVVDRLTYYLDDIGDDAEGIEVVYFGHTHARFDGANGNGIRFLNGGAPLSGLKFDVLPVVELHQHAPQEVVVE